MDSIQLKTKELLTYHCGCHGNLVTIATRYVADAYRPIELPWTQYDLRQRSYKVKCILLKLRLIDSLDSQKRSTPHVYTDRLPAIWSLRFLFVFVSGRTAVPQ